MEFTLDDGEVIHRDNPKSFFIPSRMQRENLLPGELVKLIFRITVGPKTDIERMWVIVKARTDGAYVGTLDNDPFCTTELKSGHEIQFGPEHVIQIYEELPQA